MSDPRPVRIRTVKGSCWRCRRRRIKCDLTKPSCVRCIRLGASCIYHNDTVGEPRWSRRPTPTAPAHYQIAHIPVLPGELEMLLPGVSMREQRGVQYFIGRFWPLMTTSPEPCAPPPAAVALKHKLVLLTICMVAETHRVLQDGRNSARSMMSRRGECLAALQGELSQWPSSLISNACAGSGTTDREALKALLLSVLLLYFNDGFLGDRQDYGSESGQLEVQRQPLIVASHRDGLRMIIDRLGGMPAILHEPCPESFQMLLSQFASGDLTSTLLYGGKPCLDPEAWQEVQRGHVWWTRDPRGKCCLGNVFRDMARMAMYYHYSLSGHDRSEEELMSVVQGFEVSLRPAYATLSPHLLFPSGDAQQQEHQEDQRPEIMDIYSLVRCFQHAALIYLYRAICGLPATHMHVQQHVVACLDTIATIEKQSKVLKCVTFPLLVAGVHASSSRHRVSVIKIVDMVHSEVKFTSLQAVGRLLHDAWGIRDQEDNGVGSSWFDMFSGLRRDIIIL